MGYVIIDLEFNNLQNISKHYNNFYDKYKELKNPEVDNEIIEIGAIKVDKYMKIEDKFKLYIKPSIFPILNPEIEDMTNIKETDLESGVSFIEGMEKLKEFSKGYIICSWAKDDIIEIITNSHYHKYSDLKWIDRYIDLQEYATNVLGSKKSLSLKSALSMLKIKIDEDKLHDALNDAFYTVSVFKSIYNFRILKNYIVNDIYNMPAIMIKDLRNVNLDRKKVKSICPKCKGNLVLESDYMPLRWRYISVGKCSKCNSRILNEIVIKKTLIGDIIYREIGSSINEWEYSDYSYRLEKYFYKLKV